MRIAYLLSLLICTASHVQAATVSHQTVKADADAKVLWPQVAVEKTDILHLTAFGAGDDMNATAAAQFGLSGLDLLKSQAVFDRSGPVAARSEMPNGGTLVLLSFQSDQPVFPVRSTATGTTPSNAAYKVPAPPTMVLLLTVFALPFLRRNRPYPRVPRRLTRMPIRAT